MNVVIFTRADREEAADVLQMLSSERAYESSLPAGSYNIVDFTHVVDPGPASTLALSIFAVAPLPKAATKDVNYRMTRLDWAHLYGEAECLIRLGWMPGDALEGPYTGTAL